MRQLNTCKHMWAAHCSILYQSMDLFVLNARLILMNRPDYLPFTTHSFVHSVRGNEHLLYYNAHQNFLALSTKPKQNLYFPFLIENTHFEQE